MAKYNWEAVRIDFVEGIVDDNGNREWPTLQALSEKHTIPANRVRERASKDGWNEQRSAFQAHLNRVRQDKRARDLAKEATELDGNVLKFSKLGVQLVGMRLGQIAKDAQRRQKEAQERAAAGQEADDFELPLVDAREMETLARGVASWHTMGQKALGIPDTQRIEHVGGDGGPVELDLRRELTADDPDRLAATLELMERAGLLPDAGEPRAAAEEPDPEAP